MTPLLFLAIAVAGGIGSVARLLVDGVVRSRLSGGFPLGTMVINLSGSLLLGFLTGLALGGLVAEEWRLVLGGGFLGGYTTFSTASLETVRLVQQRRYREATVNGLGMLLGAVLLAAGGLWAGLALAAAA
ncbi:fluoride efflux transporter CrcB [Compostimonas suwonensis]|uniref:Fluoride-specific ion channel FluC n=1 Tax=Compostimonas suwonensis TaxID=1048394 RepID=A0A2M9C3I0_9MICO|nr:fluoride efflux transporter CrcB [Compostimonas suwonensis]PJJ65068.1 CrcB protein [Compostimonas suwonensis]